MRFNVEFIYVYLLFGPSLPDFESSALEALRCKKFWRVFQIAILAQWWWHRRPHFTMTEESLQLSRQPLQMGLKATILTRMIHRILLLHWKKKRQLRKFWGRAGKKWADENGWWIWYVPLVVKNWLQRGYIAGLLMAYTVKEVKSYKLIEFLRLLSWNPVLVL